jgi:hypothetical protein
LAPEHRSCFGAKRKHLKTLFSFESYLGYSSLNEKNKGSVHMENLGKVYLDFWEKVAEKTIFNEELQKETFALWEKTLTSFEDALKKNTP